MKLLEIKGRQEHDQNKFILAYFFRFVDISN